MSAFELFSRRRAPCPFCLTQVTEQPDRTLCPTCRRETPRQYLLEHKKLRPLALQILGWERHGKTAYLTALLLMLTKISKVWPRYICSAVTEETQRQLQEIHRYFETGQLPPPTPRDHDQSHILMLRNMERWGSRTLLLRDCPGEDLNTMDIEVDKIPFLLRSPVALMLISLYDLLESEGRTMEMLMNNYLNTLASHDIDVRTDRRKLIVVLTKADLLHDMPTALRNYLSSDSLWAAIGSATAGAAGPPAALDAVALERYLARMKDVDEEIRRWLGSTASGQMLVRLAEEHRVDLRFSLVSSTGSPVGRDGSLQLEWQPRRVLDPYFWALELTRTLRDQIALSFAGQPPDPPARPRFRIRS